MKTAIIIQARMASTRLPNKVLINLAGKPILQRVIERCKKSKANDVIIATSLNKENDAIEKFCKENNYVFFRGSEDDVLARYYQAAKKFKADIIVRVTADCPLIDPNTINELIEEFKSNSYDYISNVLERTFPRGLDTEVFSFKALEKANKLSKKPAEREHVTSFIYGNPNLFKLKNITAQGTLRRPDIRLCLDTKEDLQVLQNIFDSIKGADKEPLADIIQYLDNNPQIKNINNESELEQLKKNQEQGIKQKINQSNGI